LIGGEKSGRARGKRNRCSATQVILVVMTQVRANPSNLASGETRRRTTTYTIPAHRLDAFERVLARSNKKAAKLGLEPFVAVRTGEHPAGIFRYTPNPVSLAETGSDPFVIYSYRAYDEPGPELDPIIGELSHVGDTILLDIEVTGQEPYLNGWTFIAAIDHAETGNVVNRVGEVELDNERWSKAQADCEHCRLNRNRLKTYLLLDVEGVGSGQPGTVKQVGSTCITDFLPTSTSAAAIAQLAELFITIDLAAQGLADDYESNGGSHQAEGWVRERVLAHACAVVREHGWVSKKAASEDPSLIATAERTTANLTGKGIHDGDSYHECLVLDQDRNQAREIVDWVEELNPSPRDDYLWNLQAAVRRPVTSPATLGLTVSAVGTYLRKNQKIEQLVPVPASDKRTAVVGRVVSKREQEGWSYGSTVVKALLLVETPQGHYKLWGNLPKAIEDVEIGTVVRFDAMVTRSDRDESFGFWSRPTKAEEIRS
jgi:hypothetical protein